MAKGDVRVGIVGDNKGLKKALAESDRMVSKFAKKGGGAIKGFAAQIGGLGRSLGLLNPALLGVAGVGGIGFLIKSSIDAAAEIGGLAKTAGISVEAFQEFQFAASQSGVSIDALTDGIKELNLRADEFAVTGKGPAEEAFRRIGMDRKEVRERLERPVEFMDEIFERVRKLNTAGKVRVFDEIFGGTAGEKFTRFFDDTIGSFSELRQEARDLGLVFDQQTINKAKNAQRELSKLGQVVEAQLTKALVELAPAIAQVAKEIRTDLQPALAALFKGLGSKAFMSIEELEADLKSLREERDRLTAGEPIKPSDIASGSFDIKSVPIIGGFGVPALKKQQEERKKVLDQLIADGETFLKDRKKITLALAGTGGSSDAAAEADRLLSSQINDTITDLKFEQDQLTRTTAEQKAYALAKSLAVTDTARFVQAVTPAAKALERERDAIKDAAKAQEELRKKNKKFEDDATEITKSARTAAQIYADEVKRLKVFLDAGAISQETFNRSVAKAKDAMESADKSASVWADTLSQVSITVGDAFADAVVEGGNLREVFDGLAMDVQKLILKMILLNSVKGALEGIGIDTGRDENADDGIFGEFRDFFSGEGGGILGELSGLFKDEKKKAAQTSPTTSIASREISPAGCVDESLTLICDEFADLDPGETTAELEAWLDDFSGSFDDVDATGAVDSIQAAIDNIGSMFDGFTVTDAGGKGQTEQLIGGIAGAIFGGMGGSGFDASAGFTDGGFQIEPSNFQGDTGGPLTASAKGSVFENGVRFMARGGMLGSQGGIITSPTLFSSAGGLTVGGEAGDEAIMPVRRDKRGRLGVEMIGNQAPNFNAVIEINGATDFDSFAQNESQLQGMIMEAGQQAFQRNRSI